MQQSLPFVPINVDGDFDKDESNIYLPLEQNLKLWGIWFSKNLVPKFILVSNCQWSVYSYLYYLSLFVCKSSFTCDCSFLWAIVFSCLLLWINFIICSLYFCMIKARACWCSSRDKRSSRFSCCNSRIWRFSWAIPNTKVERGRCFAISFSSLISSWYCKNVIN